MPDSEPFANEIMSAKLNADARARRAYRDHFQTLIKAALDSNNVRLAIALRTELDKAPTDNDVCRGVWLLSNSPSAELAGVVAQSRMDGPNGPSCSQRFPLARERSKRPTQTSIRFPVGALRHRGGSQG